MFYLKHLRVVTACLLIPLLLLCLVFAEPGPLSSRNIDLVGHLDIDGGGMVDVQGNIAAIGHMEPPYATSLLDISKPERPRVIARIKAYPGTHSHKARISGQHYDDY